MTSGSPHSDAEFLKLRDLLEEKTGLYFPADKLDRLDEVCGADKGALPSVQDLVQAIAAGTEEGKAYLNHLVEALTTNETYFFRIPAHFEVLKSCLIPEIQRAKGSGGERSLKIWSAGCASGEETYSLAILLLQALPDIDRWDVSITGTDIDLDALERARRGIYRQWSFRGVEPGVIKTYFHPIEDDQYAVADRVRSVVSFRPLNLKTDSYPSLSNGTANLDIIFCRNVTIYFRLTTVKEIVARFNACLNAGGFLLPGTAEYWSEVYQNFETRVFPDAILYQKASSERRSPPDFGISLRQLQPVWRSSPAPAAARPLPSAPPKENKEALPVERATDLVSRGEIDQALVVLAEEVAKNPGNREACFLLGCIAADRHHLAEAVHWLSRTVTLDPLHLWAHYLLGLLYLEEKETAAALQAFKRTVYIDHDFALGHFYLGKTLKEVGHSKRARKSFLAAKSLLGAPGGTTIRGLEGMATTQILAVVDSELSHGE